MTPLIGIIDVPSLDAFAFAFAFGLRLARSGRRQRASRNRSAVMCASRVLSPISYLPPPISYLLSPISYLLSPISARSSWSWLIAHDSSLMAHDSLPASHPAGHTPTNGLWRTGSVRSTGTGTGTGGRQQAAGSRQQAAGIRLPPNAFGNSSDNGTQSRAMSFSLPGVRPNAGAGAIARDPAHGRQPGRRTPPREFRGGLERCDWP
jgi:hypothetical protein